jgi:selenocysteine-specific elongation factor
VTVVVGTAGHIDHGKTTLLRALTGIDADRLPEEQRRGMTIDVGYAHLRLPDGTELDFVDVPGHDKLIGNMLVGAGEIDAALVVVAADDGPRAQTIEHLELLDALGIEDGLAVVTKADAVEPERAAEVAEAIGSLLAGTSLARAPVLVVSAATGDGLDGLRAALVALRDRVVRRGSPEGPTRLAMDRAFSIRGRGTIVTGTLRGERLDRAAILRLVPGERSVRVRELQVHGRAVDRAERGRTALNLSGVEAGEIARGHVLTLDSAVIASDRLLVALRRAARLGAAEAAPVPADRARVQLHLGTARVGGVVGRAGRDAVSLPHGEITAILRLEQPVAVAAGDRFVLRRPSPGGTIAGGRVLDARPPRGVSRRRTTPDRLVALASARAGSAAWSRARLELHGALETRPIILAPDVMTWLESTAETLVDARAEIPEAELREIIGRALRRVVTLAPPVPAGPASDAIDRLVAASRLVRDRGVLRPAGRAAARPSAELLASMDRLEAALDVAAPPGLAEAARSTGCSREGVRSLEAAGRIQRLADDLAYATTTFRRLEARALELAATAPLTPAALRDATGTSRKYVMAILEDLDRRGVLRRTPAGHVPGQRAALEIHR